MVKGSIPIVVGEKGPELFMPKQAGTIVPNHQLPKQAAQAITINMTINTPDANSFRRSEASIGADIVNFSKQKQEINYVLFRLPTLPQ